MCKVTIINLQGKTIYCQSKKERLLDILLSGIDVMHACGGKGRCTTCKVEIVAGFPYLSSKTPAEIYFSSLGRLMDNHRLACQAHIFGEIEIQIPKENQLPHVEYL